MGDALRIILCGCEGAGNSTLAGRLFHMAGTGGNHAHGPAPVAPGGAPASRWQGIGLEAPYRLCATDLRSFLVADVSGPDIRRIAGGACTADLAVLLVDAGKGLQARTKSDIRILSMFGVRHILVAINKMDTVGWDKAVFNSTVADFRTMVVDFGFLSAHAIPMSALSGDNITVRCQQSAWYGGATLQEYLDTVDVYEGDRVRPFRMAVQQVGRDGAALSGSVASGSVAVGAELFVQPGGAKARVVSITSGDGAQHAASAGDAVTITLDRETGAVCGQVLSSIDNPIQVSDQFLASVLWVSGHPLMPGRRYVIKLHEARAGATITGIKFRLDVTAGAHLAAKALGLDDIGEVTFQTSEPMAFEPHGQTRELCAFTLIDGMSGETEGVGMVNFALHRASNIPWQSLDVDKAARASMKGQRPACIWLTGLSGSGKSTIANLLEKRLHLEGSHTYLLDGDNVRHGLCRDLGFTEADRVENIRRVAETAKLMVDAGLVVIVSFISPFRSERDFARSLFEPDEFHEVFVDAPLEVCEARDAKGLYAKARRGEIANFTGIDSRYEIPAAPEVHLDTRAHRGEECVEHIVSALKLKKEP